MAMSRKRSLSNPSRSEFVVRQLSHLRQSGEKVAVIISSDITGYHVFKFKPQVGSHFTLACAREPSNDVGHFNAITVCRGPKMVGRVPRSLSNILSPIIDEGALELSAYFTGGSRNDGIANGGPKLECVYVCQMNSIEAALHLQSMVDEKSMKSFVFDTDAVIPCW